MYAFLLFTLWHWNKLSWELPWEYSKDKNEGVSRIQKTASNISSCFSFLSLHEAITISKQIISTEHLTTGDDTGGTRVIKPVITSLQCQHLQKIFPRGFMEFEIYIILWEYGCHLCVVYKKTRTKNKKKELKNK